MNSYCFTKNGYHYFLVANEDGHYCLYSDADFALQYLRANETNGIITSITKDDTVLLSLGQIFEGKVVTKIIKTKDLPFKVKLE